MQDSHKPRYIFIDLGANRGDSLDVFLQHSNAKFQYDFPYPDWATHNEADKYFRFALPLIKKTH